MADIKPFRAIHYADSLISGLGRLVCPPYDVIPPQEQKELLRRHPRNFVRLELPSGNPSDKYVRAARLWRAWRGSGVLERDPVPALYLYEASFASPMTGRRLSRRGFFAALRLVPWGKGVYPHEKTLPTPKADRLRLFKALKAQTSPIQCLFDDRSGRAGALLKRAARGGPWIELKDKAGVRHRLWRITDASVIAVLVRILKRSPVVIADGHHRYETSRAYSAWARRRRGAGPACDHVMTYFSPSDDPGLEILPTHRAVARDKQRFVRLENWGKLRPVPGLKALTPLIRGCSGGRAVGVFYQGRFFRYEFKAVPSALRRTPHEKLAVACLHAGPLDGLGKEDFFFTRRPEEAVRWARREKGWAFLLPPNTVQEVIDVSVSGRVMPPKSTYFYPKIPSGFLSHSLFGDL